MDLIQKINAKAQQERIEAYKKQMTERDMVIADLEKVKALAPRIAKLWDICQTLANNGIPLGKVKHKTFDYLEFETDCVNHWLGFVMKDNHRLLSLVGGRIVGFGIAGGGCCGRNFFVNKNGEPITWNCTAKTFVKQDIDQCVPISRGDNYAPYHASLWQDKEWCGKIKKMLNDFDDFEARVIAYAESYVG